jgi:hypothetical protein
LARKRRMQRLPRRFRCPPSLPRRPRVRHAGNTHLELGAQPSAGNTSPKTIRAHGDSARQIEVFARGRLCVTAVNEMTRETVETFIADQLARWKPTS